jgi:hypothetical protein
MNMLAPFRRAIRGASRWAKKQWEAWAPARRVRVISGDTLPSDLPRRDLVLARDGDEDWCVGMRCPCGCGINIELLLIAEAKPRWDITVDKRQRPTLTPSVWVQRGCRSHFCVRHGRVEWCV